MRLGLQHQPQRPFVPLLFLGSLIFWLAIVVSYLPLFSFPVEQISFLFLGIVILLGLICLRKHQSIGIVLALFAALGLLVSSSAVFQYDLTESKVVEIQPQELTFRVEEDRQITSFGESYQTSTILPDGTRVSVRAYFNEPASLSLGQYFVSHTQLKPIAEQSHDFYAQQGIQAQASIDAFELMKNPESLLNAVLSFRETCLSYFEAYSNDSDYMLVALLLGDQTSLTNTDLYQEVKLCGLAHLIAVSGAHLVIVSSLISFFLNRLPFPFFLRIGIQIAALGFYLVLVRFPELCMRAAGTAVLSLIAPSLKRKSAPLAALGLIAILYISFDPCVAFSVSFALSFLATLGIILFSPLLVFQINQLPISLPRWIVDPLAMTLASLLCTFPLSASLFAQFSLIAPLANILATPLISLICGFGLLALAVHAVPLLGPFLFDLLRALAYGFDCFIGVLAKVPFAAFPIQVDFLVSGVIVVGVCVLCWLVWSRFTFLSFVVSFLLVGVLIFVPYGLSGQKDEIVMFDVGQGDSFLIRSNNKTLLVDTGNQTTKLYSALARHGVNNLDALMVSHPDDDHCGSLSQLTGMVHVSEILVSNNLLSNEEEKAQELVLDAEKLVPQEKIRELTPGDVISIGDFRLTVLSPETTTEASNEDSICFLLEYFHQEVPTGLTALFCGDAESEQIQDLIEDQKLSSVTIYKVGHHGSKAALTEEQAQHLSPEISLVSVGESNRYGHPDGEVLSCLESSGSQIFRSDKHGDVVCSFSANQIRISTMK